MPLYEFKAYAQVRAETPEAASAELDDFFNTIADMDFGILWATEDGQPEEVEDIDGEEDD